MAKHKTPIELAIAGEPLDRQERYRSNLGKRGLKRISVIVPESRADELRDLALRWRTEHRSGNDD